MTTFAYEKKTGAQICCGLDEVGRAPLAGPVTAACVYIPPKARKLKFWADVRDSKKVPKSKREDLAALIREHTAFGIAEATVTEIDEINIHHASLLAMRRACEAMMRDFGVTPDMALVDGKFIPTGLPCPADALIGGDDKSKSIAAASILAKVERDGLMTRLHAEFPHYDWHTNVGYPTPAHREAIKIYGVTIHHRRTFGIVKQLKLL